MKKSLFSFLTMMLVFLLLSACSSTEETKKTEDKPSETSAEAVTLTISAAASLKDALTEIEQTYTKEHSNVKLTFNYGASGALQQQISQGAPVDLFFSAATDKFETLVNEGAIDKNDGKNLLGNDLVLVVPKDATDNTIKTFADLANVKDNKIAIGTPESVPAGAYAKETLTNLKIWDKVEPNVVYGKDVRQVLSYVETGNVAAGIVYKTDALTSDKVEIVDTAASDSHEPIIYPVGIIKESKNYDAAKAFYEYLQTDESLKTMEKYGFTIN